MNLTVHSPSPAAPSPAAPTPAGSATGGVEGIGAPPASGATTSITPLGGGHPPSGSAKPVSTPAWSVGTVAGLGGTAALLGLAVAWRLLRPRRGIPALAVAGARPLPAAPAAPRAPETPLYLAWKQELDDLADLATLTADPEDLAAARQRRRLFSADRLARRITRGLDQQPKGGWD
jgi:hypothetical protein